MPNAVYSRPFLNIEDISRLLELAINGIYSPAILVDDAIKHLQKDRVRIENSLGLLMDADLIKLDSADVCFADADNLNRLKNIIVTHLIENGVIKRVANAFKPSIPNGLREVDRFKLFPRFQGVLFLASSLNLLRHDEESGEFFMTSEGESIFKVFFEDDSFSRYENGLSLEKLQQQLTAQNIRGDAAEEFVLESERIRLKGHPRLEAVKRVSLTNVSAGFDIQSFESIHSKELDRFIEVKSFFGAPGFFWSINEVSFAKEKGPKYYLVIINSERLKDSDYVFHEIRNPYEIFRMGDFIKVSQGESFEVAPSNFYITPKG